MFINIKKKKPKNTALFRFLLHVVEEGFEHFQQVIDVPRLASLVIFHGKELLDVNALDGVHFLHPELTFQIPLQIFQLLLVVGDGLG